MEYNQLKASIAAVIKTNNRKEITGQLLQNVLFQMTNVIGENLQLAGFATPLTDPHEPDQNLFYITDQGGVYPHFDNLTVDDGLTFLMWKNGEWTSHTVGVVTQEWVDSHYVSIEFFRSLFRAYDSAGLEILPNNNPEDALPTVVDNIKAMVGFWTEQYISALGQQTGGGGGGGATSLDELSDVFLTNPSVGQALVFTITPDHPEGIWVNQTIQAGTDMATVWAALAGNTTQQINISHLTDALADYATKTYVDQNFITVAYFDRLFRAYNGSTLVSHNDVTSTIDNIKAMFGFWTEQYLSALGNNSGGGGQLLALSNMADVTLTTPIADKQVLTFDAVTQKWVNGNAQAGVTALANLTDVTLSQVQNGNTLFYDSTTSKWYNSALKTINGQSLLGSGDISVGGGASGNYLPLTGGTLVGTLTINVDSAFPLTLKGGSAYTVIDIFRSDNVRLANIGTQSDSQGVCFYVAYVPGGKIMSIFDDDIYFTDNAASFKKWRIMHTGNASGYYVPLAGGNMTGSLSVGGTVNLNSYPQSWDKGIICGSDGHAKIVATYLYSYTNGALIGALNSNLTAWERLNIGGNEIVFRLSETAIASFTPSGNLSIGNSVGIGVYSPSYQLHVAGTIYATGAITALSDARKKDITGEADVSVEQIAHAPAVQFLWKDKKRRKDGQHVGTLAQYWQTVLPEVVMDKGGELSMQYGVAALVSAIVTARKVVDHERRICELEKENERLKKEVEQFRLN